MSLPGISTKIVVCFSNAFVAVNIPQNHLIIINMFQYCDCIVLSTNKKDDFETRSPVIFAGDIFDEEAFLSLL